MNIKSSNLLSSLVNAGQLNRATSGKFVLSDHVRNDNLVRFNSVIGSLMQQKDEQKQAAEGYTPTTFQLKERYDENNPVEITPKIIEETVTEEKPVEVKTDTQKFLEEKGYPQALHSGRIFDAYDDSGKPKRSVSISTDPLKLIVIIIVGFLLISIYMKLNLVINNIEKINRG